MLASINPLGERARGNRWGWTVAAYTVAASVAGALVGAAGGTVGRAVGIGGRWPAVVLGGVAIAAGIADLAVPGRVPTSGRQVDEDWLARYRGWVYGFGFGAQLGTGVMTVISSATVFAWLAATVVSGSAGGGAIVGAAFGAARSLPFAAVARVRVPAELRARLRALTAWSGPGRLIAAGTSVVVGAACLVTRPA
jgi:hypothetical protein